MYTGRLPFAYLKRFRQYKRYRTVIVISRRFSGMYRKRQRIGYGFRRVRTVISYKLIARTPAPQHFFGLGGGKKITLAGSSQVKLCLVYTYPKIYFSIITHRNIGKAKTQGRSLRVTYNKIALAFRVGVYRTVRPCKAYVAYNVFNTTYSNMLIKAGGILLP